jgi:cytoskeletal protein CcmA (bactofilin family)
MTRNRLRRILDDAGKTTTLIGAGSTFEGDFTGKGSFIIGGAVVGDCEVDGTVTLAIGGSWRGNLRARDVILAGSVQGGVAAERKVEIGATARVEGTVSGAEIAVAEGAVIDGEMHVTSSAPVTRFTEKRTSAVGAIEDETGKD